MTVSELIEQLNNYPGNTKIIVEDSSDGLVSIEFVEHVYLEDCSSRVVIWTGPWATRPQRPSCTT